MKRVLSLLVLFVLLIAGCSQGENVFDHDQLKKELKEEGVNPKLPTNFPVEVLEYERIIPPHQTNINEILFTGEDGEHFSLTIDYSNAIEYNNFEKRL